MRSPLSRSSLLGVAVFSMCVGAACDDKRKEAPPATPAFAENSASPATSPAVKASPPASTAIPAFDPVQLNLFAPIPEGVERPAMDDATKLGRMLFFDNRLSRGQDVACASCHDFAKAGQDGDVTATTSRRRSATRQRC